MYVCMYIYMILKLDIRFFNVFILDLFFYFCFLFLYILYVYISITHLHINCCIVQYIITGGSSVLRVYLVGIYQPWIYGVAEYM